MARQFTAPVDPKADHDPESCDRITHPVCMKYQSDLSAHERWCEDAGVRWAEMDHDGEGERDLREHLEANAYWGIGA